MITARHALLRQAQEYFHILLLGVVKWDDVVVDKPIPIPAVRGTRDQGKVRDIVTAHFGGFKLEMFSPFEDEQWPLGKVKVTRGAHSVHGPLDANTWLNVANFIIDHKKHMGDTDASSDSATAGTNWGR
jgi:hypothetical protein